MPCRNHFEQNHLHFGCRIWQTGKCSISNLEERSKLLKKKKKTSKKKYKIKTIWSVTESVRKRHATEKKRIKKNHRLSRQELIMNLLPASLKQLTRMFSFLQLQVSPLLETPLMNAGGSRLSVKLWKIQLKNWKTLVTTWNVVLHTCNLYLEERKNPTEGQRHLVSKIRI